MKRPDIFILIMFIIIIFYYNVIVALITLIIMCLIFLGVVTLNIDTNNVWPSYDKPKIKQNPDGSYTVSLRDAVEGKLFVSTEPVLYQQKAVDSIKENAARDGLICGLAVGVTVGALAVLAFKKYKK